MKSRILFAVLCSFFFSPTYAAENYLRTHPLTSEQQQILKQTLASDGTINRQMYDSFWKGFAEKEQDQNFKKMISEEAQEMFVFALQFQKSIWSCAKLNWETQKVNSCSEYEKLKPKAIDLLFNGDTNSQGYKNAALLFSSAAQRKDMPNQTLSLELMNQVLAGLDSAVQRASKLLSAHWE